MQKNRGFIFYVILIIGAIIALGAAHLTLPTVAETDTEKTDLTNAETVVQSTWKSYLEKPALYIWNNLLTNFLWNSFLENMNNIQKGEPTDMQEWAPQFGDEGTHTNYQKQAITVHVQKNSDNTSTGN
jgi:hypothetical protein